jgi:hypothetical protein
VLWNAPGKRDDIHKLAKDRVLRPNLDFTRVPFETTFTGVIIIIVVVVFIKMSSIIQKTVSC